MENNGTDSPPKSNYPKGYTEVGRQKKGCKNFLSNYKRGSQQNIANFSITPQTLSLLSVTETTSLPEFFSKEKDKMSLTL